MYGTWEILFQFLPVSHMSSVLFIQIMRSSEYSLSVPVNWSTPWAFSQIFSLQFYFIKWSAADTTVCGLNPWNSRAALAEAEGQVSWTTNIYNRSLSSGVESLSIPNDMILEPPSPFLEIFCRLQVLAAPLRFDENSWIYKQHNLFLPDSAEVLGEKAK